MKKNKRKQKKVRETTDAPVYRAVVEPRAETEETPKPRRKSRSLSRLLLRLLAVAAVLALLFVGWQYRDKFMPDGFLVWADELLGGGEQGNGYPAPINGSSVKDIAAVRDSLVYLTDTSLVILNDKGGQLVNRSHNFAKPTMKVAGTYVMLAETGGKRLRLERRSGTALEHTHFDEMMAVSVAENGTFAVVSGESKSYLSQVSVYNAKDKNIFNWYSSEQIVADVSLSPDGKKMAVIGLSGEGGNICSSLLLFDLRNDKTEPVTFRKTDVMLCTVQYLADGNVAAVGDNALWMASADTGKLKTYPYGDFELLGTDFSNNAATVALQRFGTTSGGQLLTLDSDGNQRFSVPYQGVYRDVCRQGDGWLLLTDTGLYTFAKDGTQTTTAVEADSQRVAVVGSKVYTMGLTEIRLVE